MLLDHLEKLVHFQGVVRHRSIRSYALANNLAQPTVSRSIQNLEQSLETTLLIRSRDGIQLTEAGQTLFAFADRFLAEADRVETEIRSSGTGKLQARLRMGIYPSIARYFLPRFLHYIQREQSKIVLDLHTGSSDELSALLKSGKLDIIVGVNVKQSREVYRLKLFDDQFSLYRPRNLLIQKKPPIFTVPLVKDRSGRSLGAYLSQAGLHDRSISGADFETIKGMLEHGLGLGILPGRVAMPLIEQGKIELETDYPGLINFGSHTVFAACRQNRSSDAALRWVFSRLERILSSE